MDESPRERMRDLLVAFATVLPVFVVVSLMSTDEKALLAATVFGAIWVAVSERWQERSQNGFWLLVGLFGVVNAAAIWALPSIAAFKPALAVAFPLGIAEGFLLYWMLGRLGRA